MMAPRLVELRRVLKPTGSIYLHCDPTASHYLKILMDAVFGPTNFTNEISWKRTTTKSDFRQGALNWPRVRDVLLHYRRDSLAEGVFRQPFSAYSDEYVESKYRHVDADGRRYMLDKLTAPGSGTRGHPKYELMGVTKYWVYGEEKMQEMVRHGRVVQPSPGAVPRYKRYLDEVKGIAIGDTWDDISAINSMAKERLGYPTQKPEALLERIIQASSNKDDLVLDPFGGCGTAVIAAERLGRRWIGIDITHLAITLMKKRLLDTFGKDVQFKVIGEPVDVAGAQELAGKDPYQFQWWALGLVDARPAEGKKGADKGIDGRIYFHDEADSNRTKQVIFSVKAGHTGVAHVHELRGVIDREEAAIGVLISMQEPTGPMRTEAAGAGFYHSPGWNKDYPRIQLRTIAELLAGKGLDVPPQQATFKEAPKHVSNGYHQLELTAPATADADAVMVSDKPRVKGRKKRTRM